jgi:proteasome lid subunit RPN8/RPN11|tara:strand:- start:161 stop:862 length:702 start_codon:yes stop_codon:yes gene_type:complete
MSWKDKAAEYAIQCLPKESCGLLAIINGKETFWPCRNLAETPEEYFVIEPEDWADCEDRGELIGVVHSHPYGSAFPSEADKASCEYLELPFHIYSIEQKNWHSFKPNGYKSSLFGRRWIWGKHDCWSLITDYFLEKKQIKLKFWPRPKSIKAFSTNPYFEKVLTGSGFKEVNKKEIKEFDVLLMEGTDQKLNHVALYIGNQTILNHNVNQLSCRELYDLEYIKNTKKVYRYAA